jgi:hypothetical protein
MTIPSPFSQDFPLRPTPFRSRVEQQLDYSNNYFAVAFKPGFPLQASELNEIQEIFYVQTTLDKKLSAVGWTGPVPWTGATPMTANMVGFTLSGPVTITTGWYHIMDPQINGGVGVWVYNDTEYSLSSSHSEGASTSPKYGLKIKPVTVECSRTATPGTNEDPNLQDQSNFNVIGGPCGAARLSLQITGVGSTGAADEYVIPIFTGPFLRGPGARQIVFENSQTKQQA